MQDKTYNNYTDLYQPVYYLANATVHIYIYIYVRVYNLTIVVTKLLKIGLRIVGEKHSIRNLFYFLFQFMIITMKTIFMIHLLFNVCL